MSLPLPPEDPSVVPSNLFTDFSADALESLRLNWPYIRTHYHLNRPIVDQYIMRLQYGSEVEIADHLKRVFYNLEHCCRFNFALSYVIMHKVTRVQRVFYASNNTMFYESMKFVTSLEDADELCAQVRETQILEELSSELPSTKWVVIAIVSMSVNIAKFPDTILV